MEIYEEIGIKRVINAIGTVTFLGGSLMELETLQAMDSAAKSFVNMAELAEKAGSVIAEATGAEAGLVTSGAAAALTLATAACMTGKDPANIARLPNTDGMKNEIIIQKMHRNVHDRHLRVAGAKYIEVGDRSHVSSWEIEAAMNEKTAAIAYFVYDPQPGILPLDEVIKIAHKRNVPVIVDAAAELPPIENLRKYIKIDADLVAFSGGKGILGPNDTGILCGQKDLIEAAALNGFPESFPYSFGGFGIGRTMKVSKEQIVGLIVALKSYMRKDHEAQMKKWTEIARYMAQELNVLPNVEARVAFLENNPRPICIPKTGITINEKALGITIFEIVNSLKEGNPTIAVISDYFTGKGKIFSYGNKIWLNPQCLRNGEEKIVVERLRKILTRER